MALPVVKFNVKINSTITQVRYAHIYYPTQTTPRPIIFAFHGHGGQGVGYQLKAFENFYPNKGAIVVYPDGLKTKSPGDQDGSDYGWQYSIGEQNIHTGYIDQDIKFFDEMLRVLKPKINLDQVCLHGWSNGGFFIYHCLWKARMVPAITGKPILAFACCSSETNDFVSRKPVATFQCAGYNDGAVGFQGQKGKFSTLQTLNSCTDNVSDCGIDNNIKACTSSGALWATATDGEVYSKIYNSPTPNEYGNVTPTVFLEYNGGHPYPDSVPPLISKWFNLMVWHQQNP